MKSTNRFLREAVASAADAEFTVPTPADDMTILVKFLDSTGTGDVGAISIVPVDLDGEELVAYSITPTSESATFVSPHSWQKHVIDTADWHKVKISQNNAAGSARDIELQLIW